MPIRTLTLALAVAVCGQSLTTTSNATAPAHETWPGGIWTPGEPRFGAAVDSGVEIRMDDGVVLKADVTYPVDIVSGARSSGRFPVLLTQWPYGTPKDRGEFFAEHGYIYVTAYVRGTNGSGGKLGSFDDRAARDGAELVRWAATTLKNSNGKIGLTGGSYAGINQLITAVALGPNSPVKALAPYCMGSEFYREAFFSGGIPTQSINFQVTDQNASSKPSSNGQGDAILSGGPRAYDGAWRDGAPGTNVQKIVELGLPALLWSSTGDIYAQSSFDLYAQMQNAAVGRPLHAKMSAEQKTSGRYQLVISQGPHCAGQDRRITLEWFDTWLKGAKTGMQDTAFPVHAREMISNRWISTSAYPIVPVYTRLFIAPRQRLSRKPPASRGSGTVAWAQPGAGSILEYETPAFVNGASIAGPMSASFYASSTTRNLELIASLSLVLPDKSVVPLSFGTIVGSLAENDPVRTWSDAKGTPVRPYGAFLRDVYVPANEIRKYDFLISPRFVFVPSGSKLRLTVTTQTPSAKCVGMLGVDPCTPTEPQKMSLKDSRVTLLFGPKTPSSINVPLIMADCWRRSGDGENNFWGIDPTLSGQGPCQRQ